VNDPTHMSGPQLDRRDLLKFAALGGGLIMASPLLAACSSASTNAAVTSAAPTATNVGTLRWASSSLTGLDIATAFAIPSSAAARLVTESLVAYDENLGVTMQLAEKVTTPDPTTYVISVKPRIVFSNGNAVTADDVVASIVRHSDPAAGSVANFYFASVDRVEKTGPLEVTVKLKQANPFFIYALVLPGIMPKAFIEKEGKAIGTSSALPIGTGPYVATAFTADQGASFKRNDKFAGPKPIADAVEIKVISDPKALLLAARNGDVDLTFDASAADAAQWSSLDQMTSQWASALSVTYLALGQKAGPWTDKNVRLAIAHCIDRSPIVANLLSGKADAAVSVVPPDQWGTLLPPDQVKDFYASIPLPPFSIDDAKAALAQSAYASGFSFAITYPDSNPEAGKALQTLQQNLAQIGVTLTIKPVTQTAWLNGLYANPGDIVQYGIYAADYPDPGNFPFTFFDPANAVENAFNTAHWKNPEVPGLLQKYGSETGAAKVDALKQILTLANQDLAYIPLWWPQLAGSTKKPLTISGFNGLYYFGDPISGIANG